MEKFVIPIVKQAFLDYCSSHGVSESDFESIIIEKDPHGVPMLQIMCTCDWIKLFGGVDGKMAFQRGFSHDTVRWLIIT